MGDSQCTLGCFARYGNKVLDDVLQCTIEDAGCIKIAIMEPGGDSPLEAPLPPKPIIAATPASMQGRWYKVMGWNSNYDCFDCQRNSFSKPAASVVSSDILFVKICGNTGISQDNLESLRSLSGSRGKQPSKPT